MPQRLNFWPVLLAACFVVFAQDPAWQNKPIVQWDQQDAQQILTHSPWAGKVEPQWLRDLSPDERRQGGDMQAGISKGVGLEGLIGIFDSARAEEAIARAHEKPDPGKVLVRWESAEPVRAAEQKLGETNAPEIDPAYYAVAVYDIMTPKRWNIENELKGIAFLKRDHKKDFKPSRVVILRKDDGRATVVYLFPRTVEIGKNDGNLVFEAQIGRLFVRQVFSSLDMQIGNQLEL